MTKLFLTLLLITKTGFITCAGRGTSIFSAIGYVDFSKLTPEQDALYTPQINMKHKGQVFLPIENAAGLGDINLIRWLISKKVNLEGTRALHLAINEIQPARFEIIKELLAYLPSDTLICDKKPAVFMRNKLKDQRDFYARHPERINESVLHRMEQTAEFLESYELRWTFIRTAVMTAKIVNSDRVEVVE